jgi:hypothetical protein
MPRAYSRPFADGSPPFPKSFFFTSRAKCSACHSYQIPCHIEEIIFHGINGTYPIVFFNILLIFCRIGLLMDQYCEKYCLVYFFMKNTGKHFHITLANESNISSAIEMLFSSDLEFKEGLLRPLPSASPLRAPFVLFSATPLAVMDSRSRMYLRYTVEGRGNLTLRLNRPGVWRSRRSYDGKREAPSWEHLR